MDTKTMLTVAATVIITALAHYVRTGKPILFDPANRCPFFDMVRDAVRGWLAQQPDDPKDPPPPPLLKIAG